MFQGNYPQLMAHYNEWMNRRLYAACAALDEAALREDRGAFFGSIFATLEHLVWGDTAWLARFHGEAVGKPPQGGSQYADFAALRAAREALDARILDWAQGLDEDWLQGSLTWTSKLYGFTETQVRWVLVTQMFNHGTHHRGQVTTLLSQLGVDMGVTDVPMLPLLREA
ncbi:DinB family protein [Niveibacterium sp. SC-1]|uniref:DinB family protein n=1 Tax=Niveibacterium sp. SC-1 TaxID=3135646 RepID=UPI00311FCBBE